MSFQIALVTGGVVASATGVVLLTAVHGEMALEQRLAAEVSTAVSTLVAGPVKDQNVVAQRRLALEHDRTALELLVRLVVHRRDVPLEVVFAVGEIAALWAAEQPLGAGRRRRRKAGGWTRESRWGKDVELSLGGDWRRPGNLKTASSSLDGGRGNCGGHLPLHDGCQ